MRTSLKRTALAALLVLGASIASAQTDAPLRLKGRTYIPPRNIHAAQQRPDSRRSDPTQVEQMAAAGRRHFIIQFDGPISRADLAALRRAGATPLRYVPENAVAVSSAATFSPSDVPRARWIGELAPADKLSSESAADLALPSPRHPLTLVEFHPDVAPAEIRDRLAAAGTAALEATRLPARMALIPTDRTAVERLMEDDAVAWIIPAASDAAAGVNLVCAGLVSPNGLVAEYAIAGEGWDGAGRGVAELTYFQSNSSADVPFAQSSLEVVRALQEWSRHINVRWRRASAPNLANSVTIFWALGNHGDDFPFEPEVLAHAFYQAPLTPEPLAGDVHFNNEFVWGINDPNRYDIFSVMLHEAGHSLGLSHSSDPDAVMYPMYRGVVTGLAEDDVAAARQLYASTAGSLADGWSSSGVGTQIAGGTRESNGIFTIDASGRDIWDTADDFRFASRTLSGDGDIVARVDSLAAPHWWAKAGLMIRGSMTARAPHAFVLVSSGRGVAFQRRRVEGGASLSTTAVTGRAPIWLWLSRRGDRFTAYAAADGAAWTLLGSDTIVMGQSVQAGMALTSHDEVRTATASFSHVAVTPLGAWQSASVGPVDRAGSVGVHGTAVRVVGAGLDIWGVEDAFHFAWRPLIGDGEITARVSSVQATDRWAKAGVMIRADLDPGAAHAMMLVSPGKGYAFQRRTSLHGLTTNTSAGSGTAPGWVRLRRQGDVISAYRSADGVSWTLVGSDRIPMDATVYAGLAVSSHRAGVTCLAEFDRVTIR